MQVGILAPGSPRLITAPWRRVPPGTNGGVSARGLAASAQGGLTVGLVWIGARGLAQRWGGNAQGVLGYGSTVSGDPARLVALSACAGVVGSLLDSLLGATVQYSGWDEKRKLVVNAPGASVRRLCGINMLSNGAVNLVSSCLMAVLGAWVSL